MKKQTINYFLQFIFIIVTIFSVGGCQKDEGKKTEEQQPNIVVAKRQTPVIKLFFSGALEPIDTFPVVSPLDARVAAIKFDYGENVIKGQELFLLSSEQLADNYRKAVTDYLQKKDSYNNGVESYQGSLALYKAGIVSQETFNTAKSQYENTVLSFFQSRYQLETVLRHANIDIKNIEGLSLADTDKINKILHRRFRNIIVKAPGTGVALFPTQDQTSNGTDGDQKSGKLEVGTQLKKGQLMLNIGDLSGLSVKISVNEININKIKVGMPAIITGDAFPEYTLKGHVSEVATQAIPTQGGDGGGLSTFSVHVSIPKITEQERKVIRVGMTAKIQINIKEKSQIVLPMQAVVVKNGQSQVTIMDEKGQRRTIIVETGSTTPEGNIVIYKGIKPGDKVIVK